VIEVGQKLWLVPSAGYWGEPREVTVTKVGRKWFATDDCGRFDRQSFEADGRGYSSPGRCYLSKEEYDTYLGVVQRWRDLRSAIERRYVVPNVTVQDINEAMRILKLV
jgi:hypothetical protein